MFGFGKRKIDAATAAQYFVKAASDDVVEHFLRWETEMAETVSMFGHDPTPIHKAVRDNPESILIFTGSFMALSLRAVPNIFPPAVAHSIYAHVGLQLSKSQHDWIERLVFHILKQSLKDYSLGFESYAMIQELGIAKLDPKLVEALNGPVLKLKVVDFETTVPIIDFWQRLSRDVKVLP